MNAGASSVAVTAENSDGFKRLDVRVPPVASTAGAAAPSENVGSDWFALSDTAANVGYLKYAIDVVSGQAMSHDTFIVYHMEYRSRT